mmetsp:Transcript_77658/g.207489  ORF Transcript_77658/g.207489 Transcript_77658/m.207489 type:complete len:94 (-) Transcript_77658:4-285(-)
MEGGASFRSRLGLYLAKRLEGGLFAWQQQGAPGSSGVPLAILASGYRTHPTVVPCSWHRVWNPPESCSGGLFSTDRPDRGPRPVASAVGLDAR